MIISFFHAGPKRVAASEAENEQKERAGSAVESRPALKTRESKSKK